jgi:hypothetical protein
MLTGDDKFVRSGRPRLWTERFGRPGDPTVLMIMSTSTQGIGWPDELVDALVDNGRQVIRFDHPTPVFPTPSISRRIPTRSPTWPPFWTGTA